MTQPLGIYVSVPFCRAKCTFCNFASAAFPPERMGAYVDRLISEIAGARQWASGCGLSMPAEADTVFFGGGTPSLLTSAQMERIFDALRAEFTLSPNAEITMEAAPGQLADDLLETMLDAGVNRVSLGVQSFVDAESRAVGRRHTAEQCKAEIERLRRAGVAGLNVDLIAGLPLQTEESWRASLDAAIATGVGHVSVYMLEVDEDSRLGKAVSQLAVLGQEARYRAEAVPDGDRCAAMYDEACDALAHAGLQQYEISNFARPGEASRHNRKYWERAPYLGFGLDAHSMLLDRNRDAVRFARPDTLEDYLAGGEPCSLDRVDALAAFEEAIFLGLRLVEGVSLMALRQAHGAALVQGVIDRARQMANGGVLLLEGDRLRLTPHGRAISSTVFGELLAVPA